MLCFPSLFQLLFYDLYYLRAVAITLSFLLNNAILTFGCHKPGTYREQDGNHMPVMLSYSVYDCLTFSRIRTSLFLSAIGFQARQAKFEYLDFHIVSNA